MNFYVL